MQTTEFVGQMWNLNVQEDWAWIEAGDESDKEFRERILKAADKLRAESRPLLVGTHGDVLDILLRWGQVPEVREIKKGDLLIWNPADNTWDVNPVRREEGPLTQ